MNILLPKTISIAALGPGTTILALDTAAGEVAWLPSGNYAESDKRVYDNKVYTCVQAHAGAADKRPDRASAFWRFTSPTNCAAPFDNYLFTKARRLGSLTYEIPGVFIDGVALYGLEADNLLLRVVDGVTGSDLIEPIDSSLWAQAFGEFEYLFGELARATHYTLKNLPIHPNVRVLITLSRNDPEVEAAVGFISVGNWKTILYPIPGVPSVEYGVEARTKDYSLTEQNKDGTYTEYEGRKAKDISLSCVIDSRQAPFVDALFSQISGKTVAIEVMGTPEFRHLATVGKVSGSVVNTGYGEARVQVEIEGNV